MSRAWIAPRWWPRTRDGVVTGFTISFVVLPEFDNWKFGRLEMGGISIGPVRLWLSPKTINRETR